MRIPLELLPGLVSDETSYSTPGYYADGNNVRFYNGRPETDGGFVSYHADLLTGVCRTAMAWIDTLTQENVAFGTNSHLFVIKSGVLYDITPAGLLAGEIDTLLFDGGYGSGGYGRGGYGVGGTEETARTWSLANWGESLMANPSGEGIYWWQNDPSMPAEIVAGAPTSVNRMTVASTRQVVAFGCAEEVSGVYNPMCIRNSDIGNPNDWTSDSNDNVSEEILPGGGYIVDGRVFGDQILAWTNTSLFLGTFIGAADQAWRYDLVADGCGLAGPQSAVIVNTTAYWLTPDLQIYTYQYGGAPSPLPFPISREFRETIDTTQLAKVVMGSCGKFGEIVLYYPDSVTGEISRFVRLNVSDQALPWSKGDIARTAYIDSGSLLYPLAVSYEGQTYLHENGNDANGEALSWFIESTMQYVGAGERRVLLRGMWPDFEAQQGAISLTLKTRAYPQSSDVTKGPYVLAAGREKKDFMVEARLVAIRLSGDAGPSFMRLGKPTFDAVATGER